MSNTLPNLSRTEAAIAAYDEFNESFNVDGMSQDEVLVEFNKLESLGRAVGVAFGLDTADRNNPETCAQTIRPGFKVPGPGCELSFVRQAVNRWKERV
jgi:hypothetical protein